MIMNKTSLIMNPRRPNRLAIIHVTSIGAMMNMPMNSGMNITISSTSPCDLLAGKVWYDTQELDTKRAAHRNSATPRPSASSHRYCNYRHNIQPETAVMR